jgi:hypothetical protein
VKDRGSLGDDARQLLLVEVDDVEDAGFQAAVNSESRDPAEVVASADAAH